MKKVSFIIAAYNEASFIQECVESCLTQSHKNIEVCITDDGSNDGTWNLLNRLSEDPRVKISKFDMNRGKVAAFNNSFEMATGSYVAIIGADDINYPDRIKVQLDYIIKNNYDLVWGGFDVSDNDLSYIYSFLPNYSGDEITIESILDHNIVSGGTIFSSYKFIREIFPIPECLDSEDWWIGYKALLAGKVSYLNVPLIVYRQHDSNSSGGMSYDSINDLANIYTKHLRFYSVVSGSLEVSDIKISTKQKMLMKIRAEVYYRKLFIKESPFERWKYFLAHSKRLFSLSLFSALKSIILVLAGRKVFIKISRVHRRFFVKYDGMF